MKKLKQKKNFLILSLLFLTSCKHASEYPDVLVTIIDLQNVQCRQYKMIDKEKVLFDGPVATHNLYYIDEQGKTKPNKICEGLIGYTPKEFKQVQNWARDIQKDAQ